MKLDVTIPCDVVAWPIGVRWLDTGDSVTSLPTVEGTSDDANITVDGIALPSGSKEITRRDGTSVTFAAGAHFTADISIADGITAGNTHWIDFDIVTANGEKRIERLELNVKDASTLKL